MLVFTTNNAVRISLLQVGVVVFGVLGAGVGYKVCQAHGGLLPAPTRWWMDYGFVLLAVPLVWIFIALRLRRSAGVSDATKGCAFVLGILILVGMFSSAGYAAVRPWLVLHGATAAPPEMAE